MNTLEKKRTKQNNIEGPVGLLHIDDGGKGSIPVIFIHSFGGSTEHWRYQLQHLRSHRRAIAFDLRGHGLSDPPANDDYEILSLSGDIAAVADHFKIRRFVLVGHSMGGSAAVAYTNAHPDRVAGLLLTGTPGKTPEELSGQVIESLESDAYEKVMEDYMKKLLANATPAVEKMERGGMNKISKEASLNIIKAAFKYDPIPALRSYKGPVLIVGAIGEKQPNSLSMQLPEIPHKIVEGTSHWIQMDKPEAFNEILDAFLEKVESTKVK
jgi:pimeloyl-ACP methyl ester carboxylesterase